MDRAKLDLDDVFCAALELASPTERAAYLDQACGEDLDARQRVERLLAAHCQAGSFLGALPPVVAATIDLPAQTLGTMIGPYKLLQQIGEGGMGTVFMAEQMHPVRRKVALKVIKVGMDTRQVIARFEAERQALAMMDHVNIARVFDGGTTESGRPYFVMELVHGVPITKYCDDNHLTPRERLELFVPVCQAIQHAHQKGIIHRDIKPSNVMITLYDGKPVPKVIDFGVAKATEQKLTEQTLFTQYGTMVGTLEYMSPEQAEMSALGVDTRSDIYSLGVLLYELLTGSTPLNHKRLKEAAYAEIVRMIREEEPPKPSTRLSESRDTLPVISAQRHMEPTKLTRMVRGELDWIVMKALEKDRNRRYETANAFAADVERYLSDEPVQACPPSVGYRLRKFVRRNKGPVIAASVIVLSLLAGIIGTSTALVWAVRERDDKANALAAETTAREAEQKARERADDGFAHAQDAVELFFNRVTDDPMLKEKDFSDLRKKLLKAAVPFYDWLKAQQQDSDESRAAVGHAYHRLARVRAETGEAEAAMEDFRQMQAIFAGLAADFPTRPEFRQELAWSHGYLGILLKNTGRLPEAESANAAALAIQKQLAADFPTRPEFRQELAWSHGNLANLFHTTGRLPEAESAYAAALAIFRQLAADFPTRPEFRHDLAKGHNNLGDLLRVTGRLPEAESAFGAALAIYKQLAADFPTRPEFRQELAISHNNLGILLKDTGRLPAAESAFGTALAICKQLAADFPTRPEFRQELARSHNNLGLVLSDTRRLPEAESAYAAALAIYKQLAADFPNRPEFRQELATSHNNLGSLLSDTRRLPEAESAYAAALAIYKQLAADFPTRPDFRHELAMSHSNLGNLLRITGRLPEAEAANAAALAIQKQLAADFPNRPDFRRELARSHNNLGSLLKDTGRLPEAESAYGTALAIQKQLAADFPTSPEFRQDLAASHYNLGLALAKQDKLSEAAAAQFREAIRLRPDFPQAHALLGLVLEGQGKHAEAEAQLREALRLRPDFPDAHYGLGITLNNQGKHAEAEVEVREALRLRAHFPDAHYNLGNALQGQGKNAEAESEYRQQLRLRPDYPEAHCNLGHVLVAQGRFTEALDSLRRGHELGSKQPNWHYPSAEWVRSVEKLVTLDAKLSKVLQGQAKPADTAERIALAEFCQRYKKRYSAAARFYGEAFAPEPKLADDLRLANRYNAACAAALAGCGQGKDAAQLDDAERARLRRQALDWLRADLAAWGQLLDKEPDKTRTTIQQTLRHWQQDADFAGVRGDALAKLPEAERHTWQQLWADVEKTLRKANDKDTKDIKKPSN
jgi:serine/threonine protein kinase/tetratricopeptide (TPR) repeat protein